MAETKPTNLNDALLKVQGELSNLLNDKVNPHFGNTYASLGNALSTVRPVLTKHGVRLSYGSRYDEPSASWLWWTQLSANGENVESVIPWTPIADPQKNGSMMTYLKRQGLCAILAIAGEDDDDAERAVDRKAQTSVVSVMESAFKPEGASDIDLQRAEIKAWLMEMSGGEAKPFSDLLYNYTAFVNKDGQEVGGRTDLKKLTEKQIPVTHHKVKEAYFAWKHDAS